MPTNTLDSDGSDLIVPRFAAKDKWLSPVVARVTQTLCWALLMQPRPERVPNRQQPAGKLGKLAKMPEFFRF
jgi:hypothetical protein